MILLDSLAIKEEWIGKSSLPPPDTKLVEFNKVDLIFKLLDESTQIRIISVLSN